MERARSKPSGPPRRLSWVAIAACAVALVAVILLSSGHHTPASGRIALTSSRDFAYPTASRNQFPNAHTTGAISARITSTQSPSSGWIRSSATNLTIKNTLINGGIDWTGSGTLTLINDIIKPNWANNWVTVYSVNNGNLTMEHDTIIGTNVGAPGNYTKGFLMGGSGRLDVGWLNETGICQNNVGSGPTNIHDSYMHGIGSGNAATCHATGIELESAGSGPVIVRHNTIDEFPGRDFRDGSDGAVFEQGLYGAIPQVIIDHNFLHAAYWSIEISPNGDYPVTGPVVTNNCLAWPSTAGSGAGPVSDPHHTINVWRGNTRCTNSGRNTGRIVLRNGRVLRRR